MILNLSLYFQNARFILGLAYFICVIIAGAEKENTNIKSPYLLICYGGVGIATPLIEDLLFFYASGTIFSAIIVSSVLLTAVLFLLAYSLKNYYLFGRSLLIASIFLIVEYLFNLSFNISISFLDFTSLISFIQTLVMDSILIIPMILIILHGKKNNDPYLRYAGLIRIGTYIFVIITNLILGINY
jgi:hypothetical protein